MTTTIATPVHDRAADVNAIEGAIRGFVAALDKRDARSVLPLLPGDARDQWQRILENRDVRDFHARLDRIGSTSVDGDGALVDFQVHLSFRNGNEAVESNLRFTGSAARDGGGWRLRLLNSAS